MKLFYIIITLY